MWHPHPFMVVAEALQSVVRTILWGRTSEVGLTCCLPRRHGAGCGTLVDRPLSVGPPSAGPPQLPVVGCMLTGPKAPQQRVVASLFTLKKTQEESQGPGEGEHPSEREEADTK